MVSEPAVICRRARKTAKDVFAALRGRAYGIE